MMQRNWIEMMVRYSAGILGVPGVFIQGVGKFKPLDTYYSLTGAEKYSHLTQLINPHKCNHTG